MMNKETIKEFLRLDWRKIFILLIVSIFLLLLVVLLRLIYGQLPDLLNMELISAFLVQAPFLFVYCLVANANFEGTWIVYFLVSCLGILAWYFIICLAIYFCDKFRFRKKKTNKKTMKKMTIATILIIVALIGAGKLILIFEARECIAQKFSECQQSCVYDSTLGGQKKYRIEGIKGLSGNFISGKENCIDFCLYHYFQKRQISKFPTISKVLKMFEIHNHYLFSSHIFDSQKKK
ncbi:MAG: hypothetical protein U9Q27_02395 [Patescibacteria group bacterium]|nr:hypothetical protein [Patescibacteria group bacterium]